MHNTAEESSKRQRNLKRKSDNTLSSDDDLGDRNRSSSQTPKKKKKKKKKRKSTEHQYHEQAEQDDGSSTHDVNKSSLKKKKKKKKEKYREKQQRSGDESSMTPSSPSYKLPSFTSYIQEPKKHSSYINDDKNETKSNKHKCYTTPKNPDYLKTDRSSRTENTKFSSHLPIVDDKFKDENKSFNTSFKTEKLKESSTKSPSCNENEKRQAKGLFKDST